MDITAIGIGRKPFPNSESIAAAVIECEPATGTAHGEGPPIGGEQHIRHRGERGPHGGQGRQRESAPAQRRFQ